MTRFGLTWPRNFSSVTCSCCAPGFGQLHLVCIGLRHASQFEDSILIVFSCRMSPPHTHCTRGVIVSLCCIGHHTCQTATTGSGGSCKAIAFCEFYDGSVLQNTLESKLLGPISAAFSVCQPHVCAYLRAQSMLSNQTMTLRSYCQKTKVFLFEISQHV